MEMSLFAKLRMLADWSPLFSYVQTFMDAPDVQQKAEAAISGLQFAAGKTPTEIDDEGLAHIKAILMSDEGKAFVVWLEAKVKGAE
jgi:hypothetical protein